jgi:hypothetical protein
LAAAVSKEDWPPGLRDTVKNERYNPENAEENLSKIEAFTAEALKL